MSKKKNLEQEVLISETEETTDAVVVTDESEVKPAKEEEKVSKTASKKTSRKMTNLKTKKTKSLKKKASLNAKPEKQ